MKSWIQHYRFVDGKLKRWYRKTKNQGDPAPRGGVTLAIIENDKGNRIIGAAECSDRDCFNYRLGRKIATNRATACLQDIKAGIIKVDASMNSIWALPETMSAQQAITLLNMR